ncbi:hypothetical protein JCM10212_007060 [Sporobolomyces blumeae]
MCRGRDSLETGLERDESFDVLDAASEPSATRRTARKVTLRPYQVECINAVLDEIDKGQYSRLGISAPTGSGKTSIFTHLISLLPSLRHPTSGDLATRVLILVNSIQLANQTAHVLRRTWPEWNVEVEQGRLKATGLADVTVATFQTLARSDFARLDKFDPDFYKAVIVDEAHHAVAKSYLSILTRFDSEISNSLTAGASSSATGDPSDPPTNSKPLLEIDLSTPRASRIEPAPSPDSTDQSPDSATTSSADSSTAPLTQLAGDELPLVPSPVPDDDFPAQSLPTSPLAPIVTRLDSLGRPRVPLLAFTATWARSDGLALGKVFQKIVWHAEWLDMIEGNWLSQLQFTTVRVSPHTLDLANVDVSTATGEFNMVSLAKEVDREEVNEIAVQAWLDKASDRRSTLVFAINIAHILSLTNTFRKHGVDARFVYQDTKPAQREEIYEAFRRGEFRVLVNCGILTEGADFPSIDCILLLRPTRSQTLFLQMLGRGLRLSPETGKENCLVIDLVGNGTATGGVVCTPTLFGIDPDVEIDRQSTSELRELSQEQQGRLDVDEAANLESTRQDLASGTGLDDVARQFRASHVEYKEYETAFDYVSSTSSGGFDNGSVPPAIDRSARGTTGSERGSDRDGARVDLDEDRGARPSDRPVHIAQLSKLAWVGCGEDTWVLELIGKGHVKIVKTIDGYTASLYLKMPTSPFHFQGSSGAPPSPYMTPRLLALHRSLPHLLRSTDRYLSSKPEYFALGLSRTAPWRRKPASEGQKNYIYKKVGTTLADSEGRGETREIEGLWVGRPWGTTVAVDSLTKGQASDVISRTKHGAIGWWKKVKRQIEREARETEKGERKRVQKIERAREIEERRAEKLERKREKERRKEFELGEALNRERRDYEARRKAAAENELA